MKKLAPVVHNCEVLVFNKEEARALLKSNASIKGLLKQLSNHVVIPVITDGKNGAFATDGVKMYSIKGTKVNVVETTGAGDAFAAGFVAGQSMNKDIPTSLKMGLAQSEGVLGAIGAKNNLLTKSGVMKKIKKYKVKEEKL
jgi:sugar/nucleoside kinase (ribokinase family)